MQELKVKNVIIGKQFENSENLEEFRKIAKEKRINVNVVEEGDKINIEKNLYFEILWPSSQNVITDNALNNNSIVCKLVYKSFSMLFTGDIEEEAEKVLASKYKNTCMLKSDVLKVAHHGSKTSSTQNFIELIKCKIALIGVGENNKFGHPNLNVIERLNQLRCESL